MPEKQVQDILDRGIPQLTPYTLKSLDEIFNNLNSVRELGFAISEQELEEQINAVAAPIFDRGNNPVASMAVAGPAYRLTRERMIEIGPDLVAISKEISQEFAMIAAPRTYPTVNQPVPTEHH